MKGRACPALKCMHQDHPPPAMPQVGVAVHSGKSTGWRTTRLDLPQSHCVNWTQLSGLIIYPRKYVTI